MKFFDPDEQKLLEEKLKMSIIFETEEASNLGDFDDAMTNKSCTYSSKSGRMIKKSRSIVRDGSESNLSSRSKRKRSKAKSR